MALLSVLISGIIFMLGYYIKFSSVLIGTVVQYFGGSTSFFATQYLETIYKNYRSDKLSQEILIKYLRDIDNSIKENVLDIDDINNLKNFLDYDFISKHTKFELSDKNIFENKSLIDDVYNNLNKNLTILKFAGLLLSDIGVGKTTLINEFKKV